MEADEGDGSATPASNDEDHPLVGIWTFEPHKGNVVFSSAMDCWGFGLGRFALYWAEKLSCNRAALQKYLFDDYALHSTTKKIVKIDPYAHAGLKPMFVTMILEPLWQMYDVTLNQQQAKKAANMAKRAVGASSSAIVLCWYNHVTGMYSLVLKLAIVTSPLPGQTARTLCGLSCDNGCPSPTPSCVL